MAILKSSAAVRVKTDRGLTARDESPHGISALEWWFIQGYYEGERSGRRCFMMSFFRHRLPEDLRPPANGFSYILSVLNPSSGRYEVLSQVDPAAVQLFIRTLKKRKRANLDPRLLETYLSEIEAYGPPRPILLEKSPVRLSANPFRVIWKDFSISRSGPAFRLRWREPRSGRRCRFHLAPLHPRVTITGLGEPYLDPMAYVTYPRLALGGAADGEKVRGEAWLDHQWGSYGWFATSPSRGRLLGWDWFGINWDDGSDWLVIIHRDMKSRRPLTRRAVIMEPGRPPRLCRKFTAEPIRNWESGLTRIRYPVAWRVELPEVDAKLTLEPLSDDQEIQLLGAPRALWEGAGTVSGTVAGRPRAGRARLELHGYGYIFDFQDYLKNLVQRIDRRIEEFFPRVMDEIQLRRYVGPARWEPDAAAHTQMLSRPIWDLLSREGKHWRPIFGILMLEALGIPSGPYEQLASAISELTHTGALIIDDIEDDSLLRRGAECIHRRYGLDVAINAANTVYFLPQLLLSDHPHLSEKQRVEIYRITVRQLVRSHFGQGQDIYWSKNMSRPALARWTEDSLGPKILRMYADKTAAAVEGTAEVACIIAGSDPATRQTCASFARTFGVAFQIVDDVHNFSDSRGWRKTRGEDISSGKLTYVVFRALELLQAAERRRLQGILSSRGLRKKAPVRREGIDLVRRSGALPACAQEARSMFEEEWGRLSERLPPSEPKTMLRLLCSNLLNVPMET